MKMMLVALLLAPVIVGAEDKRLVNGKTIDLAPVHEWMADGKGERPMKHWKRLQVIELRGNLAGYEKCAIKIDGSNYESEALIANLPQGARAFFSSVAGQATTLNASRAKLDASEKEERRLFNNWKNRSSDTSVTWGTAGEDSDRTRERKWREADGRLADARKALRTAKVGYDTILSENVERTTVIAMLSGREYAKLKVWDCGIKLP